MMPEFEHNFNDEEKKTLHTMGLLLRLLLIIIIAFMLYSSYLETDKEISEKESMENTWSEILNSETGELLSDDEYLIHGTTKQTLDFVIFDDNDWTIWYVQDNKVIHETKSDSIVVVYNDAKSSSYLIKSYSYEKYSFGIQTHDVYELHLTPEDIENNLY